MTLLGAAGLFQLRNRAAAEKRFVEERAKVLSDVVVRAIIEAMVDERHHQVRPVLEAVAAAEGISGLALGFPEEEIVFSSGAVPERLELGDGLPHWGGERLSVTRAVPTDSRCTECHESEPVGVIYVGLDLSPSAARLRESTRTLIAWLALGLLVAGGLIVVVVRHYVSAPLGRLTAFAGELAAGDLGARPPDEEWPETRGLSRALRTMADRIQGSHDELERRVDERMAMVMREIAERQRLERKLANAERLAELGQLSAQVAHELRNPLNAIGGAVQYLRRVLGREPAVEEYGELIQQEIGRVNRFIDDLLRVARPAATVFERGDVGDVAAEALRRVTLARGLESGAVRHSTQEGLPSFEMDRRVLMEALVNLLDNAFDAGGTEPPELVTREDTAEPAVVVEVLDRGAGLRPDVAKKLGRPFVTTKPNGTGLGLVIVTHAADLHGGSFQLRNREGGGAVATLRFPVRRPHES